mmetsp:Transcript_25008/g.43180  ORF Transcript_25008/g.43180 Transcript_25008/m.43180 type:complete len:511 (+) Transcript_25008:205-1737(+)
MLWVKILVQRVQGTLLWILLPFALWGPSHFPVFYALVFTFHHVMMVVVNVQMTYGFYKSARMLVSHLKVDWYQKYLQFKEKGHRMDVQFEDVHHVVVIPNYKEALDTLTDTLDNLASHRRARSAYIVVLAMEEAESGSFEKASQLMKLYQASFLDMMCTVHPSNLPGEARGKSSNVAWAVSQAANRFCGQNSQMIVTILDADIQFSENYFSQLTHEYCLASPEERERMLFAAPIFFDRNSHEVPGLVRVADNLWAMAQTASLSADNVFKFPCSAYSVTMDLARFVGFWDAGPEAMGEDLHMFLKCFFATTGRLITKPVWSPARCSNVCGGSYVGSILSRYSQAKRHLWGSIDISYCLEQLIIRKNKPSFRHIVLLFKHMFEIHLLFAHVMFLVALSTIFTSHHPFVIQTLKACEIIRYVCLLPTILMFLFYEYYHLALCSSNQRSSRALRTWSQRLDWAYFMPAGLLYVFLPQIYAHTMQLFTNRLDYVVSAKPTSMFFLNGAPQTRNAV